MEVTRELRRFRGDHLDPITVLQARVDSLRQSNEALQKNLNIERVNYSILVGNLVRMCDERQQALEEKKHALDERKAALLEKNLNDLMLDHYRDDTIVKQRMLDEKNAELVSLATKLRKAEAETRKLQKQWGQREICNGETQTSTGTGPSTKRRRPRRQNRRRKASQSCCAVQSETSLEGMAGAAGHNN
ncbi:uncharacterized protein PG986_014475 [Apiospora aurea]|uniref:Uncharacterized protein n=1 Tax=Apiospora aurea TaxID=335848 RepID=A0ABR1PT34_9PEZI